MPTFGQATDKLVISVKEARKLLGESGKTMADSQITELIATLTATADGFLQDLGSIKYSG